MGKLILNSNGINTKTGALTIKNAIHMNGLRAPSRSSIFVVAYPDYGLDKLIMHNLTDIIGFNKNNVFFSSAGINTNTIPDYIYVTEGNTFEILWYMQQSCLIDYIKEVMKKRDSIVYIGSSAGAIIAGNDILIAKDFENNPVGRMDFASLGLFNGVIIPHCGQDEFAAYCSNNDQLLSMYVNVLYVGNDDVLVF